MDLSIILEEYEYRPVDVTATEKLRIKTELKKYIRSEIDDQPNPQTGYYHGTIYAKFYVGIIVVSERIQIIIKPKITFANFISMLKYIDEKRVKIWNNVAEEIKATQNFIDIFIRLFLNDVQELLIKNHRQGYQKVINSHLIPKGKIIIEKSILKSQKIPPSMICQTYEFTLDTIENQIIRWTLKYIEPLISSDLLHVYHSILSLLQQVTCRPIQIVDLDRIRYNRLNEIYKPIHDFCRLLLQDFSLDFEVGKEKFYTFVLNTWNVYEKFLFAIFEKFQNYHVSPYKIDDLNEDIDWEEETNSKQLPDLIFSDLNGNPWLIIDAKYKLNPVPLDEHQIIRYIGHFNRQIGFLIYPQKDDASKNKIIVDIQHERVVLCIKYYIDLAQINNLQYIKDFVGNIIKITEDAYLNLFDHNDLMIKYHLVK